MSSKGGQKSSPIPSTIHEPTFLFILPVLIKSFKIEPFGSAKTNSHFLFFDLRNSPIPEIVPPVPTPATKA